MSVAQDLPLVFKILNALQVTGLAPYVYGGIDRPVGRRVSAELVESKALVLVLGVKDELVSDDWALDWVKRFTEAGKPVLIYLLPSDVRDPTSIKNLPASLPIRRVNDESTLIEQLTTELSGLVQPDQRLH